MSEVKWVKTDKHVYFAIYREHQKQLGVFATFSNPVPSGLSSEPQMMTEWGFKDSKFPLIKSVVTWEHENREATEKISYYIAIPLIEES